MTSGFRMGNAVNTATEPGSGSKDGGDKPRHMK